MNCTVCNNTGRKPGSQYNDCTAPGCAAAEDRVKLDDMRKLQPAHHTEEEICWWAFGRGQESVAARIAELEREVAANRQKIMQLDRELSAERMVHGATKRLKEQLDAQLKTATVKPWLPIETAPKDGSEVLLFLGAPWSKVEKARWYEPWKNWQAGTIPDDPVREECFGIGSALPTHWMPLPPAPDAAIASQQKGGDGHG